MCRLQQHSTQHDEEKELFHSHCFIGATWLSRISNKWFPACRRRSQRMGQMARGRSSDYTAG
jgi:hypothetical protein